MTFSSGFALVIGVGSYTNAPKLNVPITTQDAKEVAKVLKDADYCGYPEHQVTLLHDSTAKRALILQALDKLAQRLKSDDTLFFFYSGHGKYGYGDDESYYLTTHDSKVSKEDGAQGIIDRSAISDQELLEKISNIKAKRIFLFFNACHAGAIVSGTLEGSQPESYQGHNLPEQLTSSLLGTGEGRVIITACREHQQSSFLNGANLTYFGNALTNGLRGNEISSRRGYISLFDLYEHIYTKVKFDAETKSNKTQEAELTIQKGIGVMAVALHCGKVPDGNLTDSDRPSSLRGVVREFNPSKIQKASQQIASVDELVQQVRSRIHDDIQRLHDTMHLWGVDHCVPLGDLFVDVNILETLSNSSKSELDDLWQDFIQNPNHQRLNRIGLGREQRRVCGFEVITKNTNIMVVGKPGSGKTIYLQRIVIACNTGDIQMDRIPVLIRLREFVDDGKKYGYSLELYLEKYWQLSNVETKSILNQGRSLILLDGLDEVAGENGKIITNAIKKFTRDYPQVLLLMTCRTQSYESRFERFDYVEVADFNELQVRTFADHWFKTVVGDSEEGLLQAQKFLDLLFLEENKSVRELAITPILLSLTCAVFHQTGKFYSKRSKLYEEGLELLLVKWDKNREIERDQVYHALSVAKKKELLSYLAIKKFKQSQYILFEQEELERYIADFLGISQGDSQIVLKSIESQHGLLIERSQKVWSFSHLTFQEYLVALNLIYKDPEGERLLEHLYEKKWEQVILMFAEKTLNPNGFVVLFKLHIDKSASIYKRLQIILKWAAQKASNTHSCYSQITLRGFYLSLIAIINTIDELEPPWLPECLIDDFSKLLSMLDDNIELSVYHCSSNGLGLGNYSGSLEGEPAFDRNLCHARAHASLLERTLRADKVRYAIEEKEWILNNKEEEFEFFNNIDDSNFFEIADNLDQAITFCEENGWQDLGVELLELYNQLPPDFYGDENQEWFCEHGKAWTEKLRQLSMYYRQVDQKWELNHQDWSVIYAYIYANRMLINCLNENTKNISDLTNTFIRETLLIPYSELESIISNGSRFLKQNNTAEKN